MALFVLLLSSFFCFNIAKPLWVQIKDEFDDEKEVTLFLALKQRNLDKLEEMYWDRTNPESPNYRNWLSIQELDQLVSVPMCSDKVYGFLEKHKEFSTGMKVIKYADAIEVKSSIRIVQDLLQVRFSLYENERGERIEKVASKPIIPSEIESCVDFVSGINQFWAPRILERDSPDLIKTEKRQLDFDTYVVPQTLYNMYRIPPSASVLYNSSQGVIEWESQSFSPQELTEFGTNMAVKGITSPIVVGQNDPSYVGIEATLDIQYISATGVGAQNWFWLENGDAWLYGFAVHFFNTKQVPFVISMSYGWNEADQCMVGIGSTECQKLGVDSKQYVQRVNVEFQKIGLRGVSMLASSGDSGANGRTDELCFESHFNPVFPAASPFVTAVGATELINAESNWNNDDEPPVCKTATYWWCASGGDEEAVSFIESNFNSGGGFSNIAPLQSWQQSAVASYLQTPESKYAPASYYNASGRGYPDIAALGSGILIWIDGDSSVGGTSASSPIVAGIFSLINDQVIKSTNKPLGPLNPLIYKMAHEHPSAFTDILIGNNRCTESGCGLLDNCEGFYCAKGWDPVTGWGTPVYSEMLSFVEKLITK